MMKRICKRLIREKNLRDYENIINEYVLKPKLPLDNFLVDHF